MTKPQQQLWDDDAFRQRCVELARRKGVSLRQTMIGAKTSADYLLKSQVGRNTDVVLRLARYFQVDPAVLFGVGANGLQHQLADLRDDVSSLTAELRALRSQVERLRERLDDAG